MTNLNSSFFREETTKSVGASCKLYQQTSTLQYKPLNAGIFNFHSEIITDLRKFINACVLNPTSEKTLDEEVACGYGIGGRLPCDYAPSYHKAVEICRQMLKRGQWKIEKINDTTAWLVGTTTRIKIRIKEL